jgi:hypothetical protein
MREGQSELGIGGFQRDIATRFRALRSGACAMVAAALQILSQGYGQFRKQMAAGVRLATLGE